MTNEIFKSNPEKREVLDDDARKFIIKPLDDSFFEDIETTTFNLVVDWIETDENSETKLAHKTFENNDVQILLISKAGRGDDRRKTTKIPISEEEYQKRLSDLHSPPHLEKKRYEFTYVQSGISFGMKYDVFANSELIMLEVDATNDEERAAFIPEHFSDSIEEVTGNMNYYGYRICSILR